MDAWLSFLVHSGSRSLVPLGSLLLVASKVVSALLFVLLSLFSCLLFLLYWVGPLSILALSIFGADCRHVRRSALDVRLRQQHCSNRPVSGFSFITETETDL